MSLLKTKPEFDKQVSAFLSTFKIVPKNFSLYLEALTHISYSQQHHLDYSYERLEFLGDAIIDKMLAEFLYQKNPNFTAGNLSKEYVLMSQGKSLSAVASKIGLTDLIIFGGTMRTKEDITNRVLEDIYEALVGAIYLDLGEPGVMKFLKYTLIHYYSIGYLNENQDFKSELLKYIDRIEDDTDVKLVTDFDKTNKSYIAKIMVNNVCKIAKTSERKVDAENEAARVFLSNIKKNKNK